MDNFPEDYKYREKDINEDEEKILNSIITIIQIHNKGDFLKKLIERLNEIKNTKDKWEKITKLNQLKRD